LWRIHDNAIRMSQLIDGLLSLARVGRSELAPAAVDLSGVARRVVARLAAAQPTHRVSVSIEPGLRVRIDPALGETLVASLLDNAWKFTREAADPTITVGESPTDRGVFFVQDNGAGFDMAHVGKLFLPFQRLHGADEYPGTGIGLATCHRIVERHGGRIWAEGRPGGGTTVFFTVPSTG
jgi:light-regulated signal transduction histidine kinase (bacteriophytochrome)